MKISLLQYLARLEPVIVILLLAFYAGVNLPEPLGSPWSKLMKLTAYALVPLLALIRWKRCLYVASKDIPLLLLTGLALLSFLWSASPDASLSYGKALFRTTIFGLYLATCYSPKEQMRMTTWAVGIASLLSLFVCVAMPATGVSEEGLWQGVFNHKNTMARFMALATLLLTLVSIDNRKRRWLAILGIGLSLFLLVKTQGKTSLSLLLFGWGLLPIYYAVQQKYKLRTLLILAVIVIGGGAALWLANNLETIIVDGLGKDMTMSGRDELWDALIYRGMQRPWFGYGFAGFWNNKREIFIVARLVSWFGTKTHGHAHSGFIDLFLQVGFVGVGLYVLSLVTLIGRIIALLNNTGKVEYFWFLEFTIVSCLFNYTLTQTILNQSELIWLLYIANAFSTALQQERLNRTRHWMASKQKQMITS
ncbi:MAG: O-antigen ligase family protein [Spirulinaceae cyanobacterium]